MWGLPQQQEIGRMRIAGFTTPQPLSPLFPFFLVCV